MIPLDLILLSILQLNYEKQNNSNITTTKHEVYSGLFTISYIMHCTLLSF